MKTHQPNLQAEATNVYQTQRAEYLSQLVAPMDDMWAAFADMAAPHALRLGEQVVGHCCVDDEQQLVRFFVQPLFQQHSVELLRLALKKLRVRRMMVFTLDPNYLSSALDIATKVEPHSLLFTSVTEPDRPGLENLREATPGDQQVIVDFQEAALGAPREFLEHYTSQRLERRELLLFEQNSLIHCLGELRRDSHQANIAQLGIVVGAKHRNQGLGSAMLSSLVTASRKQGFTPCCSTEVTNLSARRAIERAGFHATHRLLSVEFDG